MFFWIKCSLKVLYLRFLTLAQFKVISTTNNVIKISFSSFSAKYIALLSLRPYGNRDFEIGRCLPSLLTLMQLLMKFCVPIINHYEFKNHRESDLQFLLLLRDLKEQK